MVNDDLPMLESLLHAVTDGVVTLYTVRQTDRQTDRQTEAFGHTACIVVDASRHIAGELVPCNVKSSAYLSLKNNIAKGAL